VGLASRNGSSMNRQDLSNLPTSRSPKLVCFDLDGTLIRGTTVSLFLAQRLGHDDLIRKLECQYRRGRISNSEIADASAKAYRGLAATEVERLLADVPVIGGLRSTVARLKRYGLTLLLCTITWTFAARVFQQRFGLDGFCGTPMGVRDNRLTGIVLRHFDEHDKLAFVQAYCRQHGLSLCDCAAVGDSRSDIPLFREVGLAITLNATDEARSVAHVAIDTEDLSDVLPLLVPQYGASS
jgi:phosphoserine phosphatase